jgi:hypothetical protein
LINLLIYSYLFIPLCFLIAKGKIKESLLVLIALYGIVFFALLFFHDSIPDDIKKYRQAFYTFLEYSAFTYIFWVNVKNKLFKKFVFIVSILFLFFQIYYVTAISSLQRMDSIPIGIETILIFIYIFFFLYDFSKNSRNIFIYNHYCFWLSVGILIYLGGSFFYYILINNLDKEDMIKFGTLTYVAEIIKNLLFCTAIFIYKKFPINKINKPKNIPNLDMNMI